MYIRIFDTSDNYCGIDRNFNNWCKHKKGSALYMKYTELELASEGEDEKRLDEYIRFYDEFCNLKIDCEMVFISNEEIRDENLYFYGIDIANDYFESIFAVQYDKYDILNKHKLLDCYDSARHILNCKPQDEAKNELNLHYVYKYKMKVKEQILSLLKLYNIGKYETKTFCEIFMNLYYGENSGSRYFVGAEKKALDELAKVVERFSPYQEDLKEYPDVYISEEAVKIKFDEVKNVLGLR